MRRPSAGHAGKTGASLAARQARLVDVWAEASRRAWNWALSEWERQHHDHVGGQRFKRVGRAGVVPVGGALEPRPGAAEAVGRQPCPGC